VTYRCNDGTEMIGNVCDIILVTFSGNTIYDDVTEMTSQPRASAELDAHLGRKYFLFQ